MALCAMAVVSGHMLVVVVWKRLNTCCLLLRKVVNGSVHSARNQLSISSLSISGINNSLMSLQPIIDEPNTIQTDAKHPDVSETSLHHSGSHSEDRAKKRSTKNRNYYERHKTRILLKRKQRYQENAEGVKTVSRAVSKVNYARNPQPKKDAARAASKVNYTRNPQPKKDAARAASINSREILSLRKMLHVQRLKSTTREILSLRKMLHVQRLKSTTREILSLKRCCTCSV